MASLSGRDRMIDSVNALRGDTACTEAVLMQQRPPWAFAVFLPVFVVVYVVTATLNIPTFVAGALAGGLAGMSFVFLTTYWIAARSGSDVVLAKSSKMSAKAVEIESVWPAPLNAPVEGAVLSKKVTLDSTQYYLARQFEGRFRQIVS